ncbi:hypothetical protein ACFL4F_03280 [Candidatus Margulisiibacteriota bacterium]
MDPEIPKKKQPISSVNFRQKQVNSTRKGKETRKLTGYWTG